MSKTCYMQILLLLLLSQSEAGLKCLRCSTRKVELRLILLLLTYEYKNVRQLKDTVRLGFHFTWLKTLELIKEGRSWLKIRIKMIYKGTHSSLTRYYTVYRAVFDSS